MLARLPAVVQDVLIVAPGVLKGISKDWHSVEGTVLVDASSKRANVRREPSGVNDGGTELLWS